MTGRPDPLAPPEGYGSGQAKPWTGETKEDTRCDVREGSPLIPGMAMRCAGNGAVRVWFGCVNEHVGYVDLCAAHEDKIDNLTACWRCNSAGHHGVRVRVIRRQELPAATADRLTRSEISTDTPRGY